MRKLVGAFGSTVVSFAFASLALAVTPPALLNYQGVLRSAANAPLSGTYDMTFRLFDDPAAGSEILVDAHTGGSAVTASGGLFNVQIGSGTVTDGSGFGTYTTLSGVFRDYPAVYLQVEVGGETLTPRTRIVAAAYSLNASNLNGKDASSFLDTSSTIQTKTGRVSFDASGALSGVGVTADGPDGGGYFFDSNGGSGHALVGYADIGIEGGGNLSGGYFHDLNSSGYAYAGIGDTGIEGVGAYTGGYFHNPSNTGYAFVGSTSFGIAASGSFAGGSFQDSDQSGYAQLGYGDYGVEAAGNAAGGYFHDLDSSGYAHVGYGDYGIESGGNVAGGYFHDLNSSGTAYAGYGDTGVLGTGSFSGGSFSDSNNSGNAYVGFGDRGIEARGYDAGGAFFDSDASGYALVATGDTGVQGYGTIGGLYGKANTHSGEGWVGVVDDGLRGYGLGSGAYFQDTNGSYANVAYDVWKILGTGSMGFIQNHPSEKDQVVVYNAPEGDEVAVYTRGTARLVDGVARVQLGKTFAWVANPDLGLTAYVTPIGAWADLYVESKSTDELIVRSRDPQVTDVMFDYIVYGLRIGFEEVSIVQPKQRESWIPPMTEQRAVLDSHPDLRDFDAFERFKAMRGEVGEESALDLSASRALHDAIGEYDVATQGLQLPPQKLREAVDASANTSRTPPSTLALPPRPPEPQGTVAPGSPLRPSGGVSTPPRPRAHGRSSDDATPSALGPVVPVGASLVQLSEAVEAGEVVAVDPTFPGHMKTSDQAADAGVVGVAVGEPGATWTGSAPVATSGIVSCRVDATYGAIKTGDLLTVSPTRGHAMRATSPAAGTILGKALEPLEDGTGVIQVVITLR